MKVLPLLFILPILLGLHSKCYANYIMNAEDYFDYEGLQTKALHRGDKFFEGKCGSTDLPFFNYDTADKYSGSDSDLESDLTLIQSAKKEELLLLQKGYEREIGRWKNIESKLRDSGQFGAPEFYSFRTGIRKNLKHLTFDIKDLECEILFGEHLTQNWMKRAYAHRGMITLAVKSAPGLYTLKKITKAQDGAMKKAGLPQEALDVMTIPLPSE